MNLPRLEAALTNLYIALVAAVLIYMIIEAIAHTSLLVAEFLQETLESMMREFQ